MSSICFGSVDFTPHSPAFSPAFDALHEGIDLAFGDFRLHANREGILRFPDSNPLEGSELASASTTETSSSSSSDYDQDSESSTASIFYDDYDYHSIATEESIDYDADRVIDTLPHRRTRSKNRHETHFAHVCMAGSTAATSSAERRTINVSQEAWNRAKDAVDRSVVMPEDATREDMMAYHYLLSKKNQEMAAERAALDERRRLADLSSQRRAELSAIHNARSTGRTPH